jgi:hypothetical protein
MLEINEDPLLGLFNGSMGTVVGLVYLDETSQSSGKIPRYAGGPYNPYCDNLNQAADYEFQLPIVLVQFDETWYPATQPSYMESAGQRCVVPIAPQTVSFKSAAGLTVYRTQLPLTPCSCVTIHKCQGLTCPNLVWILGNNFCRGLPYVAHSRVKTKRGLYVVQHEQYRRVTMESINKWDMNHIHLEYNRLRNIPRKEARRIALAFQLPPEFPIEDEYGNPFSFPPIEYIQSLYNETTSRKRIVNQEEKNTKRLRYLERKSDVEKSLDRTFPPLKLTFETSTTAENFATKKIKAVTFNSTRMTRNSGSTRNSIRPTQFWNLDQNDFQYLQEKLSDLLRYHMVNCNYSFWRNPTTRNYVGCCDIVTLMDNNWLNGSILDACLAAFKIHFSVISCRIIHAYFYTLLNTTRNEYQEQALQRITDDWNLQDLENDIIFPIHRPGHWILCVISKKSETINIIDPLYEDIYEQHFHKISQWYRDVQIKLGNNHLPPTSWEKKLHRDYSICKQTDGTSCGVLAFFTAAYYMITGGTFPNARDNYSQSDVRELRCYMQYIIFHIKEVQSTVVIEDDDEDDEIQQLLRDIELSQQTQDQETFGTML